VVDPHREFGERALERCAQFAIPPEQVLLIDLGDPRCLPAWQPLARGGASIAYKSKMVASAVATTTGQQHFDETQQLKRWLDNVLWPVIEAGCGFPELAAMLAPQKVSPLREAILQRCSNATICAAWQHEFAELKTVAQRMQQAIGSTVNRLSGFYTHPFLRRLLGQTEDVIDWRRWIDDGGITIVICDGGVEVADEDCRTIGLLMLADVLAALRRPPSRRQARACYFIIDEVQRLLSWLLLTLLRECRKQRGFGILCTQDVAALHSLSPELYRSTLSNCRTKVVFGGLTLPEIHDLCADALAPIMDPDMKKLTLARTFFAPVETTRLVQGTSAGTSSMVANSEGESESESWSEADIASWADSEMHSESSATFSSTSSPDVGLFSTSEAVGYSARGSSSGSVDAVSHTTGGGHVAGRGGARAHTHARTVAQGQQSSRSVSRVPFHELHERQETSSVTFRSCDEQLQVFINAVHSLERQHALVVQTGQPPHLIKIWTVREPQVSDGEAAAYRAAIIGRYRTPEEIDTAIEARQEALLDELARREPERCRRRSRRMSVNGNGVPTTAGNGTSAVDPVALIYQDLERLDHLDEAAVNTFLSRLRQLAPAAQRPFLDRLALESGRPKSYFSTRMRAHRHGSSCGTY
jgi:hypothetical protein